MSENSILISHLLTQSDIRIHKADTCLRKQATLPGNFKEVWYPVAKIYERFKKGMTEGV